MSTDNILENAPDTQLDNFPAIGEIPAETPLSDAESINLDMPELASTATATLTQRRRDRANEREQKLRKNAKRFYRAYFIGVAVMLCVLFILMIPLHNWLVRFETTQPDQYSQYVYETYFAQPNWAALYDMAEMGDANFVDRDAYVRHMQAKVEAAQNKQITFYETSAGLSADHKYIVELDGERIATFMLTGSVNAKNDKTQWKISDLQLVADRNHSVSVQRLPGQKILINGKEIGDEYIVRMISTKAESELPEGIHGLQLQELYVDGLMANPAVEVLDADGNPVATVFNADENRYTLDLSVSSTMTDSERELILNAAKSNGLFAIRAIGTGELSKYFDNTTQIYKDICNTPTFIQSFASYSFNESVTAISDFYRYSEGLFSARVTLQLDITRKNGTVKSFNMNTTYIFTKNAAGNFKVTDITNVNLQETTEQVRLSFECNGTILSSVFVDTAAESITLPQCDVQPGQTFLGWATRSVSEDGQIIMTIVFAPGDKGLVPSDLTLEPMTLYAVFGAEGAVQ